MPLAAQFRKGSHCGVVPDQSIPCGFSHNSIYGQTKDLLKFADSGFCLGTENSVHRRDFGNRRIVLRNPVQFHLNDDHTGAGISPALGPPRVGGCQSPYGSIRYNFHIPVIAGENLGRGVTLLGQVLASPLAETFTSHGSSITELGSQGLYKSGPPQIVIE